MTDNQCFFCKINKKTKELFWQNKYFKAFFDAYPVTPGHFLIVPQRHIVNFEELNTDEWSALKDFILKSKEIALKQNLSMIYQNIIDNHISDESVNFCRKALQSLKNNQHIDAYNYGINDGRAAGRTIDHLHIHVIPRYKGDVINPTGGVRGVIPQKQNYR
jgi:histidine triad (HIT) family protein